MQQTGCVRHVDCSQGICCGKVQDLRHDKALKIELSARRDVLSRLCPLNVRSCVAGACTYLQQILFREVLQLCSHALVGWPDAPSGLFGLWSFQVAAI